MNETALGRPFRTLLFGTVLVAALALALAWSGAARGAVGDFGFHSCVSGGDASTALGTGACAAIPGTSPTGANSGLNGPDHLAASPDGRHVYAAGSDDAITWFERAPGSGALTFAGCLTGDTGTTACTQSPTATAGGDNSGFGNPGPLTISPDGENVYVTTLDDDGVTRLDRNPATGALSFGQCISARNSTAPPCTLVPGSSPGGNDAGLNEITAMEVSLDGRSLYASSDTDDALTRFDRAPTTGAITHKGCISGSTDSVPCTKIPAHAANGVASGMNEPDDVAVSPDGATVYAVAELDESVVRFTRAPGTGAISYAGCFSGNSSLAGTCTPTPSAKPGGSDSGMSAPRGVAVSPDGASLYVASRGDSAVTTFNRAPAGGLTFAGCISGSAATAPTCTQIPTATASGADSGLEEPFGVVASLDGQSVYARSPAGSSLAGFRRSEATGALTYDGCISGDTDTPCALLPKASVGAVDSGLQEPEALVLTRDGRAVLAASQPDDAVSSFTREPAPACSDGLDNDGDGKTDHPADPGCAGPNDGDETDPLDNTAPKLKLKGKKKQSNKRRVVVKAKCNEACSVVVKPKGKATVKTRAPASAAKKRKKKLKLKTARANLSAGQTKRLKLKFKGKKTKRLVKRALRKKKGKIKLKLRGKATDGAGNKGRATFRVKLKKK
ncbi:MAG TPA: beta-propeller fold lactonase family protein [Solirubrobacterales bacterium]|nr:beta-propeller fold lactonase family protein [Solirubrobacterales bacterium]